MKQIICYLLILFFLFGTACSGQTTEPSFEDDVPTETPDLRNDPDYIATRAADLPTPFPQEEEQRTVTDPITLETTDPLYDLVSEMKADLKQRLDTPTDQIDLVALEAVDWPNGAIGCPEPDVAYLQVITPGYRLTFSTEGAFYNYHTKDTSYFTFCEQSNALPKSIGTPDS